MSFQACFECGLHTASRTQIIGCDHEKYTYDWKRDIPDKLDEMDESKENRQSEESS